MDGMGLYRAFELCSIVCRIDNNEYCCVYSPNGSDRLYFIKIETIDCKNLIESKQEERFHSLSSKKFQLSLDILHLSLYYERQ